MRDLPLRKAPGHDGIQNEHIIHAGPQLLVHLSLLFTAMLRHSYVPENFRLRIIRPILKSKHGDSTSLDRYQEITLTPSLSKLFERVLVVSYSRFHRASICEGGLRSRNSVRPSVTRVDCDKTK